MVDALLSAWRVLAEDGILIDLRPLDSAWRPLEVVTADRAIPVGEADGSGCTAEDAAADRAAARVVEGGWFLPRTAARFEFELSWDTVEEMASFMEDSRRMRRIRPTYSELERIHRRWCAKTSGSVRLRYRRTLSLATYRKVAARSRPAALPSKIR